MSSFSAKVKGIPCLIDLDDDYKIVKIATIDGGLTVEIPKEEIAALEEDYDFIIADVKKEDDNDAVEYEKHIRRESSYVRQL